jgi:hypothetical protein
VKSKLIQRKLIVVNTGFKLKMKMMKRARERSQRERERGKDGEDKYYIYKCLKQKRSKEKCTKKRRKLSCSQIYTRNVAEDTKEQRR